MARPPRGKAHTKGGRNMAGKKVAEKAEEKDVNIEDLKQAVEPEPPTVVGSVCVTLYSDGRPKVEWGGKGVDRLAAVKLLQAGVRVIDGMALLMPEETT